jgi:1,2-diacylglycerol 3-alpha-glucosyltransferase
MRLLIAGSTYPPQINGQSVFTGSLASSMAAAGHDVMVMTPSEIGQSYRSYQNGILHWAVRSIDLSFIHRDFFIAVAYYGMVNDALDTFQPDVIHLQDSAPLNQYILRAARKRGIPVIITHHIGPAVGAPYFTWFTDLLGGRMIGLVWKWVISFLNQADVLTAPSRAAAEMLRRHRVTPPVWPISCGVSIDQFEPISSSARAALREQWGLPQDRTVFLYVGRLDWEKRPEVLLNAIARLASDQAYLVLAGTGAAERELRAVAKRLQLGEQVRFLGDINHERVSSLFEACDIFVMPGDVESLSIATLEAMACGKPVLAANAMALPELVQPGLNGQLFKPRSSEDAAVKMEWFINQPNQWKRMGQASRERAASHSIPAVMCKFESLYRETAAQAENRRRLRTVKPTRSPAQWSPQRLLPHLKALFLLAFLFLSSVMIYSDTTAAPHILLETLDTFQLENTKQILIVSPHPDDAVLVAGGTIQEAVDMGITVQIVVITNGKEPGYLPLLLESGEEFSVYRYRRDALIAYEQLGVPEQQVIFLDYPSNQWETLVDSASVKNDRFGEPLIDIQSAVMDDLRLLMAAVRPEIILIPHPDDHHPDHKVISHSARTAAARLFSSTAAHQPLLLGYLVDYETYPDAVDLINLSPLLPPASLTDLAHTWLNSPLNQNQVQEKLKAISAFPLETNRIGWTLTSFARPNEIFSPLTIRRMPFNLSEHLPENRSRKLTEGIPALKTEWFLNDPG